MAEICKNCPNGCRNSKFKVYCICKNKEVNDLDTCILFFPKKNNGYFQVNPAFVQDIIFAIFKAWQMKEIVISIQGYIEKLKIEKEHDENIFKILKDIQDKIIFQTQITSINDEYFIKAISILHPSLIDDDLGITRENIQDFLKTDIQDDLKKIYDNLMKKNNGGLK